MAEPEHASLNTQSLIASEYISYCIRSINIYMENGDTSKKSRRDKRGYLHLTTVYRHTTTMPQQENPPLPFFIPRIQRDVATCLGDAHNHVARTLDNCLPYNWKSRAQQVQEVRRIRLFLFPMRSAPRTRQDELTRRHIPQTTKGRNVGTQSQEIQRYAR